MKKMLLSFSVVIVSAFSMNAQTYANATLDINQAKAGINSNGDLFWNYSQPQFEVPADSGRHTIYAAAAWMGGLDSLGGLHVTGQMYRQSGSDFFQGPVMNSSAYSSATDAQWNQVWKINKTTIDSFVHWSQTGQPAGYVIPSIIMNWPAHGNAQLGQAQYLLPFIDIDGDQNYNPIAGDYPCIKGDQACVVIFNDDRNAHGETGGNKFGIEVHAMIYAYSAPGTWLDSTVFLNYQLINRSTSDYESVYWGMFNDFDIGSSSDDYSGCDVQRNIAFAYNADANDGSSSIPGPGTYGANPPAEGMQYLRGPLADANDLIDNDRDGTIDEAGEECLMNHFVAFDNNFTSTGNPVNDTDYYDYLRGFWIDGTPLTYGGTGYGGTTPGDFMYPGTSDPLGWGTNFVPEAPWDEVSSSNLPADQRTITSSGPFTLSAGEQNCISYAYIYGRGTAGPVSSVDVMRLVADSSLALSATTDPCACDMSTAGINSHASSLAGIYPNPATTTLNIICGDNSTGATIEILDMNGKVVKTSTVISGNSSMVDVSDLAAGLYFVRVNKGSIVLTGKFIRN